MYSLMVCHDCLLFLPLNLKRNQRFLFLKRFQHISSLIPANLLRVPHYKGILGFDDHVHIDWVGMLLVSIQLVWTKHVCKYLTIYNRILILKTRLLISSWAWLMSYCSLRHSTRLSSLSLGNNNHTHLSMSRIS